MSDDGEEETLCPTCERPKRREDHVRIRCLECGLRYRSRCEILSSPLGSPSWVEQPDAEQAACRHAEQRLEDEYAESLATRCFGAGFHDLYDANLVHLACAMLASMLDQFRARNGRRGVTDLLGAMTRKGITSASRLLPHGAEIDRCSGVVQRLTAHRALSVIMPRRTRGKRSGRRLSAAAAAAAAAAASSAVAAEVSSEEEPMRTRSSSASACAQNPRHERGSQRCGPAAAAATTRGSRRRSLLLSGPGRISV